MAAPRITLDPGLESCPDYASALFKAVRDLIIAGAPAANPLTDAEAANHLSNAWNADCDARKLLWAAQVQANATQAAADAAAVTAQEALDCAAADAAAEAERLEAEKKKPKLGVFDSTLAIPDYLGPRVSSFAKKKLEDKEYVELWYWTKEGCLDAESLRGGVEADDSFGITQVGSTLSLKPLTAYKASKKVLRDEDLSWSQLSIAKTGYLAAIEAAGWPNPHRAALASFFYAIENHPSRMNHDDYADSILVIYTSRSRRFWHDSLSQGKGFNIAIINEKLMEQISTEFHNKLRSSRYRTFDELADNSAFGARGSTVVRSGREREAGNKLRSASPARAALPGQAVTFFQQGTSRTSDGLSACAVCVGRHRHEVRSCNSSTLWNVSTQARSKRNAEGSSPTAAGSSFASLGNLLVATSITFPSTSAPDAGARIMALRSVISHRSSNTVTPFNWITNFHLHPLLSSPRNVPCL
ncbi:hypothetical protein B0H10DRAFT_2217583 [Mycena sp. CBHHK59/15]|nr:hypothetical protein B0H10DRAFT_2217583 [Mycena sp. CBHHK59/15]